MLIATPTSVRIAGHARRRGPPASRLVALVVLIALSSCLPVEAAPVEVRFIEGVTRGFLIVRSTTGQLVAHGELLQTAHPDRVDSRMTFRFKDGSFYDEQVVFTQKHVFAML